MTFIERIVDVETNEVIERAYTKAEIDEINANAKLLAAAKIEAETKAAEKTALLERLGITVDEAKLLIG